MDKFTQPIKSVMTKLGYQDLEGVFKHHTLRPVLVNINTWLNTLEFIVVGGESLEMEMRGEPPKDYEVLLELLVLTTPDL